MEIKTTNDILFNSCNEFTIKSNYLNIKYKEWVAVDDLIKELKNINSYPLNSQGVLVGKLIEVLNKQSPQSLEKKK